MTNPTGSKRDYSRLKYIILALAMVAIVCSGCFLSQFMADEDEVVDDEVRRVMIMGVDRRADDIGRSDTLMVASLDEATGKGTLMSIPRDTLAELDKGEFDKINHAYAYGGHKLTQKAVEGLLGLKMDHYILIDTKAFERVIDAIGGVDIDVEKRMYYEDPWDDNGGLVIDLYPGFQHLDGENAIHYVRYRDEEGDIGRIGRQQKFMQAVMDKVLSPEILPKIPDIISECFDAVETDMSITELVSFAGELKRVKDMGVTTDMVPGKPAYYQGISYWLPDIVALREKMAADMDKTLTDDERKAAEKKVKYYETNIPKNMEVTDEQKIETEPEKTVKPEIDGEELKKEATKKPEENKTEAINSKPDEKVEEAEKLSPEDISVTVLNCSGIDGAGARAAEILAAKGFVISEVTNGDETDLESTRLIANENGVELFYGLPFSCVIIEGESKAHAVLEIGQDFGE